MRRNIFRACMIGIITCSATSLVSTASNIVREGEKNIPSVVRLSIKGKVVNEKGEVLPGVSIAIKGSSQGTITGVDGKFLLEAPSTAKLIFSYIGYLPVEKAALNKQMTIVMKEDAQALGEVVVTAQKKAQSSVEIPAAISALSGGGMKKLNIQQIDELSPFIPGVQFMVQSPNNPGYVIRGVTSDEGTSYSQPRVSVFQDGVSISRSRASVVEMFDLDRVEVVKGPQGTLFGRGAEIGGINIIRNKPVNYLTGEIYGAYGTRNQQMLNGYINTPIVKGKLANRFAFAYNHHDGFNKNLAGGRLNGKHTLAFRNSTRWWLGDKTTMDLVLDFQSDRTPGTSFKSNKPAYYTDTDPNAPANLEMGKDLKINRQVGGATFTIGSEINDYWKLSSITGVRGFKSDEVFDADGTPATLLLCEELSKGTQASQEFRWSYDSKKRLSGFLGASYFFEHSSQAVTINTNVQQLFPAYAGVYKSFEKVAKPKMEAMEQMLSNPQLKELIGMLTHSPQKAEAAIAALKQGYKQLMQRWFPEDYPAMKDGKPYAMATTPDFYKDVNNLMQTVLGFGLTDLPNMINTAISANPALVNMPGMAEKLGAAKQMVETMGGQLEALKKASAIPLQQHYQEEGTNYGTNQAAEIFVDGSYKLLRNLTLTMGVRGTLEHQYSAYSSVTHPMPWIGRALLYNPTDNGAKVGVSKNYCSWVGRVALNYWLKDSNFYLNVSRGRRPGVIYYNNSPTALSILKPEIILSYELGVKGALLNHTLSYELCAYYYDWSHFQTNRFDSSLGLYVADDAGKAHSMGVELGFRYSPAPFLNVFGNYTYINGKFNEKDEHGAKQAYAGNTFRLTPKNAFAVGCDFNLPLGKGANIYVRPSYSYKSKVFFEDDNSKELSQNGFGLLNANAGVRFHCKNIYYDLGVFGKNILDEKYIVDAGNSGREIGFPTFVQGSRSIFGLGCKIGF